MELRPILSAMGRNKFGAILIAVQIAITLGFLANALSLIEYRMNWSARPTGLDESNIFVISTEAVSHAENLQARLNADLDAIRSLPGVIDAFATNGFPLRGGGWVNEANIKPAQLSPTTMASSYFGDERAVHTLGLNLIAGRNFTADEIQYRTANDNPQPGAVIVTAALAKKLYPDATALGKPVYLESLTKPNTIVGVVERLQGVGNASTGLMSTIAENSTLAPFRPVQESSDYMVRTTPGRLDEVNNAAERKLYEIDSDRILRSKSMLQVRADAYRGDRGLVILLMAICAALLIVTGFGIIGLTSYWVSQRRQQIGIRRALGATRRAIVNYFQTENFLIAMAGTAGGIAFAIGLNLWMVHSFEMVRMDNSRALAGAALMLLLGQAAVLWPAFRAASIPPALATRGG